MHLQGKDELWITNTLYNKFKIFFVELSPYIDFFGDGDFASTNSSKVEIVVQLVTN